MTPRLNFVSPLFQLMELSVKMLVFVVVVVITGGARPSSVFWESPDLPQESFWPFGPKVSGGVQAPGPGVSKRCPDSILSPSSVVRHSASGVCRPPSVACRLPSVVCRSVRGLSCVVRRPSSVCCLSSVIRLRWSSVMNKGEETGN